jgi:hypothetical protein
VIPPSIFHRVLNSQRINVRSGDNCAFPGCQQGNDPASAAEFEEFQALQFLLLQIIQEMLGAAYETGIKHPGSHMIHKGSFKF